MTVSVRLSWNAAVTAEFSRDGEFRVLGPTARLTFSQLSEAAAFALQRLAPPGEDEGVLADVVLEAGGTAELSRWYFMLQRLASRGLVVRSVHAAGARLATLVPMAPAFRLVPAVVARRVRRALPFCLPPT